MRNKLSDLNNYLFETLERLNDDSLSQEELEMEMRKSEKIASIGKVIIDNAKLSLEALRLIADGRVETTEVPEQLRINEKM